jgi:hypothetical protein
MRDWGRISRKEFLKLAGIATGVALQASSWPGKRWFAELELPDWPSLLLEQLPARLQQLLQLTPDSLIDAKGNLLLLDAGGNPSGSVPLAPTQWNQEHSHVWDKLYRDYSWGIVLHWFGDHAKFDYGLDNYLWGFNGLREVKGYLTRTSAHFLVGAAPPVSADSAEIKPIGILQMQAADKDGTPYVASHLQSLNYEQYKNKEQYFVGRCTSSAPRTPPSTRSCRTFTMAGIWTPICARSPSRSAGMISSMLKTSRKNKRSQMCSRWCGQ